VHIFLTPEGYEPVKKFTEYAAIEGLIEGHPGGMSATTATFASTSARTTSSSTR